MENKYSLSRFNFENEEQYNKFKSILINNNYLNPKQKEEVYKGLINNLDIFVYSYRKLRKNWKCLGFKVIYTSD